MDRPPSVVNEVPLVHALARALELLSKLADETVNTARLGPAKARCLSQLDTQSFACGSLIGRKAGTRLVRLPLVLSNRTASGTSMGTNPTLP